MLKKKNNPVETTIWVVSFIVGIGLAVVEDAIENAKFPFKVMKEKYLKR